MGKREDLSGPALAEMLAGAAFEVKYTVIIPDDTVNMLSFLLHLDVCTKSVIALFIASFISPF
jgi:molybdopterin biosynthesis enzyme MoaB